jgi:hypothetical protein
MLPAHCLHCCTERLTGRRVLLSCRSVAGPAKPHPFVGAWHALTSQAAGWPPGRVARQVPNQTDTRRRPGVLISGFVITPFLVTTSSH